jgi:antitoxin MazE
LTGILSAAEGTQADMTVENGALVVKVATPMRQRRYSLEALTDAITPENAHRREIDWGPPRGNEVW